MRKSVAVLGLGLLAPVTVAVLFARALPAATGGDRVEINDLVLMAESSKAFDASVRVGMMDAKTLLDLRNATDITTPDIVTSNTETDITTPGIVTSNTETDTVTPSIVTSNTETDITTPGIVTSNTETGITTPGVLTGAEADPDFASYFMIRNPPAPRVAAGTWTAKASTPRAL